MSSCRATNANAAIVAGSALGFLIVMALHSCAHAEPPLPRSEWTSEARLVLARALLVEGGNDVDRAAIAHTLARRWRMQRQGWTFVEQTRRYSRPLSVGPRSPRQRWILAAEWHELPRRVRVFVDAWGRGQVPDPCPASVHWAARSVVRVPLRWLTCSAATNAFIRRRPL